MGNQRGNAGNQGGNLSIAVKLRENSNGNEKLKKLREVKMIKNEHICKHLVSRIRCGVFGHISHNVSLLLLLMLYS